MKNTVFKALIFLLTAISSVPLVLILFYVSKKGIAAINWSFLVNLPKPVGEIGGGISNAIIGSFLLILVAVLIAVPLGILTGLYLNENSESRWAGWTRLAADVLQGTPSIVLGIIAYLWIVKPSGKFSAFSGSIALAFMMFPIIIRSTEETLKLIPSTLKEASLSLGVPYYKTILRIVVPAGLSGIVTGIILSVSRIAGETAPLLFTAFGSPYMNLNILKPVNTLPLMIFNYATSPYEEWHQLAWGASFILLVLVLLLNLIARFAIRRWKIQF